MIDQFCIFDRGGTIYWNRSFVPIKGDPVALLVRSVLLEDRLSIPELSVDNYTLRWKLDIGHDLVFVVVFQRQLPPPYADILLESVRQRFATSDLAAALADRKRTAASAMVTGASAGVGPTSGFCEIAASVVSGEADLSAFDKQFDLLLDAAQRRADAEAGAARSFAAPLGVAAGATTSRKGKKKAAAKNKSKESAPLDVGGDNGDSESTHPSGDGDDDDGEDSPLTEDELRRRRQAFLARRGRGRRQGTTTGRVRAKRATNGVENMAAQPVSKGKVMRAGSKINSENEPRLDFSEGRPAGDDDGADEGQMRKFREQYLEADRNRAFDDFLESDEDDDDDDEAGMEDGGVANGVAGRATGLVNYFKGLAGMRSLTREDLKPAMEQFRDDLVGKNVAKDIADKVIESVVTSLEGKTMESMTRVTTMVRKALDEALTRILTPRQSTEILSEIAANRGKGGRPYVIAYCGVNGVGKSTSLAKTCYYLLNHGYKVMIAACDTFRAGAVEQLRTHVKCLGRGVELFDRGYGKDAAAVAADAIRKAKELGFDVVLVDTAGRMQDNEPLMRALSKLVEVNRPDRLFFVGEALVGNDAVDQLTKFNKSLTDNQAGAKPRLIDGIVLTKFDTIDDKVGAAVSMVYTTGQPIVFIGIGQTYMDLRKMNTRSLVKALLK